MDEYKSRLSAYLSDMVREELEKYDGGYSKEWNKQRKKNAEVLGYKLSGKNDIKESAVSFWQDMFRPGPIPKQYINQLIKKKGELPSKSHIKKIYKDNGNPSSSELAKSWKQLTKEKYVRAASGMWRWNADFTGWESVNEAEMIHVLTKDIGKKKMKDLEQYLWHVLDLEHNKDFRLSSNGKILSVNIDKINSKSVQNIKKRYGVDLHSHLGFQVRGMEIAINMAGNMTGAVKKIEKIKKGLSKDKKVADVLRKMNESVNEAKKPRYTKDGKLIITKARWLRLPDYAKLRKKGVEHVLSSDPKKKGRSKYIPVQIESINYDKWINEGFEKYHLGNLLDSKLKKRLERAIKLWGGKIDAVGMDTIKFRLSSSEVTKLPLLLKKLDQNKNVWIGDKRKNNIWDRKRNIDKLHKEAFRPKGVSLMKKIVFLPKSKLYFDPDNGNFWLMGPYGGEPDWEEDPIEPKDRDYKRTLSRLSSKDKSIMKKSLRGSGNWKEATTSVSVPGYLTPNAFKKSTQKAIDVDDEDDEKSESMAAPFRRRNSRGLGRVMKESGILYKAGVKKYGKEGMAKILSAAGKKKSHAEIGAIKDKYEKDKKESVDELQMAPFSSQEARAHINSDIKDMSKHLGKASQQVIKIMMDGVRKGKYTAMDISRGIKEGPAARTHYGEMTFIQSLWTKMRDKFRRYSKDGKLS